MLDAGEATEEHGRVWSATLAWSGSWRITTQRTPDGRAGFTGGVGHDGTNVPLAPGEEFATPPFAGLCTDGGFGAASRAWHAYTIAHVLPHPDEVAPVLYNSWEATGFDVDEVSQKALAERAAELGVELYVVDDGWFGARRSDRAGLGDWTPSPDRFPNGLTPLVDSVHRLGMSFGLWVEPEMVNPDSDLYRQHPDWVLHFPDRPRSELRNQLVLNFARRDVADWAYDWLTRLVGDNGIDFLKWDMNRAFSGRAGPGSRTAPTASDPSTYAICTASSTASAPTTRRCGSSRAAAVAAGSTWASCPVRTRRGRRTTPTPPTGWGSSTATARSIPRARWARG